MKPSEAESAKEKAKSFHKLNISMVDSINQFIVSSSLQVLKLDRTSMGPGSQ